MTGQILFDEWTESAFEFLSHLRHELAAEGRELNLLSFGGSLIAPLPSVLLELFRTTGTVWIWLWFGCGSILTVNPVKDWGEDLKSKQGSD